MVDDLCDVSSADDDCRFCLLFLFADLGVGGFVGLVGGDAIKRFDVLGGDGFDDLKGVLVGESFLHRG